MASKLELLRNALETFCYNHPCVTAFHTQSSDTHGRWMFQYKSEHERDNAAVALLHRLMTVDIDAQMIESVNKRSLVIEIADKELL